MVEVGRFCVEAGFVFLDLFLADEFHFAFHPRLIEDAPGTRGGNVVEPEVGFNPVGMQDGMLVLPHAGAEGGDQRLVEHAGDDVAGGSEAVVLGTEGSGGILDEVLHCFCRLGVLVGLKNALNKKRVECGFDEGRFDSAVGLYDFVDGGEEELVETDDFFSFGCALAFGTRHTLGVGDSLGKAFNYGGHIGDRRGRLVAGCVGGRSGGG